MSTSLCDVTMTLKQQEKTSFSQTEYVLSTRKCMFDTFSEKCTRDYTAPYTSRSN